MARADGAVVSGHPYAGRIIPVSDTLGVGFDAEGKPSIAALKPGMPEPDNATVLLAVATARDALLAPVGLLTLWLEAIRRPAEQSRIVAPTPGQIAKVG